MQQIRDAILSGDRSEETYAGLPVPDSYRAVTVHKDEVAMFEGLPSREKDPRRSLHVDEVPVPELAPGEALVAVMASAINYNSVWTSIFEPVSTFGFLKRYGKVSELTKRHDLPYHVIGSDLAGVVLRTGPGVNKKTGVAFTGTVTWTVTLKAGTYTFRSDAHRALKGTLKVS